MRRFQLTKFNSPIAINIIRFFSQKSGKVDYSNYPKLIENELEEKFIRGSGPGGQSVNKTASAVLLRHIPTDTIVKCHVHRSLHENRKEARKILLNKIDNLLNGEKSTEAQLKVIESKKHTEKLRRQKITKELKEKWKEREKLDRK